MATIKIAGEAIVVTSGLKVQDIKDAAKWTPDSLRLVETGEDNCKKIVFSMGVTSGEGALNSKGISFHENSTDADGHAQLTIKAPNGTSDVKGYFIDTYGLNILQLDALEDQVRAAIGGVRDQINELRENIVE